MMHGAMNVMMILR